MRDIRIIFEKDRKEKEYIAVVNVNVMRNYSRIRGIKSVNGFMKDFSGFDEGKEDISFDDLDKFAVFFNEAFREGMRKAGKEYDLEPEDIMDLFMTRGNELMKIMTLTNDGLDDMGERKAPAKGVKPKAKKR